MLMKKMTAVLSAALILLVAGRAFAQGGGASTTGTIVGKVADSSGAVLPGVTVTAASASLMGTQASVTNTEGVYRFPALPPGIYALTFELAGFNSLKRENIQIALGFTATVNVELSVATLQETVTVTGESPVIDTTATRVQQNFKLEALNSLPNSRDMWSLLATTPGVTMSRIDVGGNRAGTQTGYSAYGYNGQVRVLVEGINTTEGTGGAGFYFDYGSFEEVFLGTAGQGAEMPNPGVQSQFLGKSGGNRFSGELYQDYERNSFQAANISDNVRTKWSIRPQSNEIQGYRDMNLDFGGPIKNDKVWWYFSYRDQKNRVAQPNFLFDKTFDTRLWNPSGKATYQINQNNKLIGYYQWGQKIQPNRLPFSTYTYDDPGETWKQNSGSWVYKSEWNSTLSSRLYVEARYGVFGYYFPLVANEDPSNTYYWRDTGTLTLHGGDEREQTDRQRRQWTGAATYFADHLLGASHNIKFGGELYQETEWRGFLSRYDGHVAHIFNNGAADQVILDFPTATRVDSLGAGPGGDLLSVSKLDQSDLFFNDQMTRGRVTLNLGVRWDRYQSWIPAQQQLAFEIFPGCARRTDVICAVGAQNFSEQTFFTWNSIVPRIGVVYDLQGNGKTVLKANYGLYRHNPGPGAAASGNPNQSAKTVTYGWRDANGDRHFQLGEQTTIVANNLSGAIAIDPAIRQPYTNEASIFFEQELTEGVGARFGFVYKTNDDLTDTYLAQRPIAAYTQAFSILDRGIDATGTADDRAFTVYGIPNALLSQFPATRTFMNVPEFNRFKTLEAQVNKRYRNGWSMQVGGSYTWRHDFPSDYPNTPNGPFDADYTRYEFKASGSYDAPWGIRFNPLLRFQAGANFARTLSASSGLAVDPKTLQRLSCGCTLGSTTIWAEPYGARRQDNITLLDLRTEKTVGLGSTARVRLFFDLFNIFNRYAAETIGTATGPSFLRPTAILAPRTMRVGFRFVW
jgi:hypothetical protein